MKVNNIPVCKFTKRKCFESSLRENALKLNEVPVCKFIEIKSSCSLLGVPNLGGLDLGSLLTNPAIMNMVNK